MKATGVAVAVVIISLLMQSSSSADDGIDLSQPAGESSPVGPDGDERPEQVDEPAPSLDDVPNDLVDKPLPDDVVNEDEAPGDLRWFFDFAIGGGSVIGFTDPLTTGHLAWGGVFFHIGDFAGGLAFGATYPGSRVQTRFTSVSIDGRWYFAGARDTLRPYAVFGLGFSGVDELDGRNPGPDVVRWAAEGSLLNVSPGVGLRWGNELGLFVQAEARTVNLSHAVFSLGGGFAL